MVMDAQGDVMSKSRGNVVSPIGLMADRGVDITRLAMFFTAPSEKEVLWSNDALTGLEKFVLNRLYPVMESYRHSSPDLKYYFKTESFSEPEQKLYLKLNQTIKKVDESFERLQFNTAIAALMELIRDYSPASISSDTLNDSVILKAIQMIAPLAPHLAEELWERAGYSESIFRSAWPTYDPAAIVGDTIEIAVQIKGKLRDTVTVAAEASQTEVEKAAFASPKVHSYTQGKEIIKKIYVPGRLLNIVTKG